MTFYKLDILKSGFGEFWTNVYYLESNDFAVILNRATLIASFERGIMLSQVTQERMRISTVTEGDDIFNIIPLGGAGQVGDANPLPLFNTVRVDLAAATGRPGRKYLRGCLGEAQIGSGVITSSFIAQIQLNYVDELLAIDELRHVDQQTYVGGTVKQAIQMRQLRRGSKRKTGQILPPS